MRRVTAALTAVDGVSDAQVSLAEKRAVVTYDPRRAQPAAMTAAIREAGYEPGEPSAAPAPGSAPPAVTN